MIITSFFQVVYPLKNPSTACHTYTCNLQSSLKDVSCSVLAWLASKKPILLKAVDVSGMTFLMADIVPKKIYAYKYTLLSTLNDSSNHGYACLGGCVLHDLG